MDVWQGPTYTSELKKYMFKVSNKIIKSFVLVSLFSNWAGIYTLGIYVPEW